ncbi:MAG: glutathione-disulfide reductase [Nannocystaceae bacterium]
MTTARKYDFDLFTIGAGSGGVRASRLAGGMGARVAVAESSAMGGTCVNLGCVPKKLFVYASEFADAFTDARGFGWDVGPRTHDWAALVARKDAEIRRLNGIYERLLNNAGVEILRGHATVVDPHTVELDGRRYTAEHILVATGSWPVRPGIPGGELAITSNDVFHLEALPARATVVGGGYIGVEFAGIFHGLGLQVTQLYRGRMFLRGFDDDLRQALAREMRRRGLDLRMGVNVRSIVSRDDGLHLELTDGTSHVTDLVMFATGRSPRTRGLGLERAGVTLGARGEVVVDDHFRSSVPSILAIGDVIGRVALTPVALAEGSAVAHTLFGERPTTVDYANIPTGVFSQPPMASVGYSEHDAHAHAARGRVDVYVSEFRPLKHTLTGREERTFMKLVVCRDSDRVLGAHMLGPDAPEIIQGLAIALVGGATKAQFDQTIGLHPSAAEEFVTMRQKRAPDAGENMS